MHYIRLRHNAKFLAATVCSNSGSCHFTCLDHSLTWCGAKLVEAELIWNIPWQEIKNTACNWSQQQFVLSKSIKILSSYMYVVQLRHYVLRSTCRQIDAKYCTFDWKCIVKSNQRKKVILTRNTLIDILANKVSSGAFFIFYWQFMKRGLFMNMRLSWNGWWRSGAFILSPWSYIIFIEYQRWFTLKEKQSTFIYVRNRHCKLRNVTSS